MAKVVTITNPVTGQPTQVDQLEHTAQQIDDAADRATGYGLGSSTGRTVSNVSLNSLIENGWYYLYRNNTDGPDGANISDAILFVSSARSDLTKVQRLILGTQGMQGYEFRRVYNNSSWLPWECVNPHMKLGVEYRTTWRYMGKPVYAKLVNFGTLPNCTSKSVSHGITELATVLYANGTIGYGTLLENPSVSGITLDSTNITIATTADLTGFSSYVTLLYFKYTD